MGFLARLFGICQTALPENNDAWIFSGKKIVVDLSKITEIAKPGSAVRLEGKGLSERILLLHGIDDQFYAYRNKCSHIGGRRIDPLDEPDRMQCCSVSKSTYNYAGHVVSGPAKEPLKTYPVEKKDNELIISI